MKFFNMLFRMAACVVVAALAVYAGRRLSAIRKEKEK